jgi:polyhydroxyalkanoate synthesis regulator phasin
MKWLDRQIDKRMYQEIDRLIAANQETVSEVSKLRTEVDRLRLEVRILQQQARKTHE